MGTTTEDELVGLVLIGTFEGVEEVQWTDRNTAEVKTVRNKRAVRVSWAASSGRKASATANYWVEDKFGEQSPVAELFENDPPKLGEHLVLRVAPDRFGDLFVRRVERQGGPALSTVRAAG